MNQQSQFTTPAYRKQAIVIFLPTSINSAEKPSKYCALLLAMTHRAFRVLAVTWPMCARIVQYRATSPSSVRIEAYRLRRQVEIRISPTTSLPWFISRLRSQPTLSSITFLHESVLELVMQAAHAPDLPMSGQVLNQVPDAKQRLSRALFDLNLKLASCQSGALVQVRAGGACLSQCQEESILSLKTLVTHGLLSDPTNLCYQHRYGCQMCWQTAAWC